MVEARANHTEACPRPGGDGGARREYVLGRFVCVGSDEAPAQVDCVVLQVNHVSSTAVMFLLDNDRGAQGRLEGRKQLRLA